MVKYLKVLAVLALAGLLVGCWATALRDDEVRVVGDLQSLLSNAISRELGVKADPAIEVENEANGWVFVSGHPVLANGDRIDYSTTNLRQDWNDGYVDDVFMGLLKKDGRGDELELKEFSIGSTDAPFIEWIGKYGLPSELFK